MISSTVEFLKWNVVLVAIKIRASYLLMKKVACIMGDKHVLLCHPLWQLLGLRAFIMERHTPPRVIALSNLSIVSYISAADFQGASYLINSVIHLCSGCPRYIITAIFGRLCHPELQYFIDGWFWRFLSGEVIICELKGKSILKRMKCIIRFRI